MFARLKNNESVRILEKNICNKNEFKIISELVKNPQSKESKNEIAYIMPYSYSKFPCHRTEYESFNILFLDYDDNADKDELISRFKDYKFILHTSFSHQYDYKERDGVWHKVEPKNKYRVILFLDSEYPVQKYMKSGNIGYMFIASHLKDGKINMPNTIFDGADLGAFKPTGFFGPCKNIRNENDVYDYFINENGKLFDLGTYLVNLGIQTFWDVNCLSQIRPKFVGTNDEERYIQNLMQKYKRTITQRCAERGTGVHAAMCKVNAGLAKAKCDLNRRIAFMNELFLPTCNDERNEISKVCNGFGG